MVTRYRVSVNVVYALVADVKNALRIRVVINAMEIGPASNVILAIEKLMNVKLINITNVSIVSGS